MKQPMVSHEHWPSRKINPSTQSGRLQDRRGRLGDVAMPEYPLAGYFLKQAQRFREMARTVDGTLRADLEELAIRYEELAEHVEMLERFRPSRRPASD
jgi:hypothetical protein